MVLAVLTVNLIQCVCASAESISRIKSQLAGLLARVNMYLISGTPFCVWSELVLLIKEQG